MSKSLGVNASAGHRRGRFVDEPDHHAYDSPLNEITGRKLQGTRLARG
jgi:hypothetical protein